MRQRQFVGAQKARDNWERGGPARAPSVLAPIPVSLPPIPERLRANDNAQTKPSPVVRFVSAPPPCFRYDTNGPGRYGMYSGNDIGSQP